MDGCHGTVCDGRFAETVTSHSCASLSLRVDGELTLDSWPRYKTTGADLPKGCRTRSMATSDRGKG